MKKMSQVVLGSILTFASAGVLADDHEKFAGDMDPAEPMSVQAQICNLNDGVSLSDYNKVTEKYKKWAKKNDGNCPPKHKKDEKLACLFAAPHPSLLWPPLHDGGKLGSGSGSEKSGLSSPGRRFERCSKWFSIYR